MEGALFDVLRRNKLAKMGGRDNGHLVVRNCQECPALNVVRQMGR